MLSMTIGQGNPKKVLQKAAQLGVHPDCVASDIDGACGTCVLLMHTIYDFFYGHLKSGADFLEAVLDDLQKDRDEEFA